MQRLLHSGLAAQAFADLAAAVVFAIGDVRPAVVGARPGQVDFVAALRPVLMQPERTVGRERGALGIAVAIAPDFGQCARPADKGIVGRYRAVLVDAHDLAVVVVEFLRILLA